MLLCTFCDFSGDVYNLEINYWNVSVFFLWFRTGCAQSRDQALVYYCTPHVIFHVHSADFGERMLNVIRTRQWHPHSLTDPSVSVVVGVLFPWNVWFLYVCIQTGGISLPHSPCWRVASEGKGQRWSVASERKDQCFLAGFNPLILILIYVFFFCSLAMLQHG